MENDESASHLSLEKTASTVQIASTTVERTMSKAAPATTGRTAWDALVDMGGMLGRYTPWIIIVAGVFYGTYKFRELQQHAQKDAQDAAQSQIDEAHKDLRDTYEQIGKMHQQQLERLSSMLDLDKKTTESTKQKQAELDKLQEETKRIQLEAQEAQKTVDHAAAEVVSAKRQKDLVQRSFEQITHSLEQKRQESEKNQRDLALREAAFSQRADTIIALKDRLTGVAKHLVDSTDASVATLGRDILKEFSPLDVKKMLTAYAKQPGKDTAKPLDDLLGSGEETLDTALRGEQGLGFSFWQKYTRKDGTKTAYVGVVHQTDVTDDGVVLLTARGKGL